MENQIAEDVPDAAPTWDELRERSPYDSEVRDDPSGGVVIHRCHPGGEVEDFFAFAMRHETMKHYVERKTYLFTGPVEDGESPAAKESYGRWNSAVRSFKFRAGSHEDCPVCREGDR